MNKSNFTVLGIEPTDDLKTVKKAYAKQISLHHPEDDPEGWRKIHDAYTEITEELKSKKKKDSVVDVQNVKNLDVSAADNYYKNTKEDSKEEKTEPEVHNEKKEFKESEDCKELKEAWEPNGQDYQFDFDDFRNLVDELVDEGRADEEKEKAEAPIRQKNQRMMDKLHEIADFNKKVIYTDAYKELEHDFDFAWAMTRKPFVETLTYYFQHLNFSKELVQRVEADVQRAKYYIKSENIETDVNYNELLKAVHSRKFNDEVPIVSNDNTKNKKKKTKTKTKTNTSTSSYSTKSGWLRILPLVSFFLFMVIKIFAIGDNTSKNNYSYELTKEQKQQLMSSIDLSSQTDMPDLSKIVPTSDAVSPVKPVLDISNESYATVLAILYDNEEDVVSDLEKNGYSDEDIDEIVELVKKEWEKNSDDKSVADAIEIEEDEDLPGIESDEDLTESESDEDLTESEADEKGNGDN